MLEATRPHVELYRHHLELRGLAASTIDRRLATVCGFYRFAHIDGRITSNPAQYVRRPKVHPSEGRGLDRDEVARFLFTAERIDHDHAALAVLLALNGLRVSEACETSIENMGLEHLLVPLGDLAEPGSKTAFRLDECPSSGALRPGSEDRSGAPANMFCLGRFRITATAEEGHVAAR